MPPPNTPVDIEPLSPIRSSRGSDPASIPTPPSPAPSITMSAQHRFRTTEWERFSNEPMPALVPIGDNHADRSRPKSDDPVDEFGPTETAQLKTPFLPPLPAAYTSEPVFNERPRPIESDGNSYYNLELIHNIDFSALTYIGTVDENLICSICRTPFFNPVITDCCHIFCHSCLHQALKHGSSSCPIDRTILEIVNEDYCKAPTVIRNQVDALKAECPACSAAIERSVLQIHLAQHCPEARMACPGKNTSKGCAFLMLRKHLGSECMHYAEHCPDCNLELMAIDMDHHRNELCTKRIGTCQHCGAEYVEIHSEQHLLACPDLEISCKWSDIGCDFTTTRKTMVNHEKSCNLRFMGKKFESMAKESNEFRNEIADLKNERNNQERRIKALEGTFKSIRFPFDDISDPTSDAFSGFRDNTDPSPTGFDHVMALMDSQQRNINKLSTSLRELEARYSTLLFNETIQIRNDLAELRSLQQTTSMHVRWLMQFRLQENRRVRAGTGLGSNAGGSEGSDGSPMGPRRSSDSLHQPPRL
ncbi:uncharacterized protein PAC_01906 [Phialocephala subalpina]|uniref:RING-type domain-containing protein n=1 Tax=Phialocephala subalpina TaxID=576137 RepID=A0A1L7WGY9_9HELO|nr:uncharacterized protein PAC_01906 [Phialocephala subalpina]